MPQNERLLKDYLDLDNQEKLPQIGHTKNVYRVRKKQNPQSESKSTTKYQKTWILKEIEESWMNGFNEPIALASELTRLWGNSSLPKTRLVCDDPKNPQKYYYLSEEVVGYQNYKSTATQKQLQQGNVTGFASILVISLLLGQADINTRDIGINKENKFTHFDDDHALCLCWQDTYGAGYDFDFTSKDIDILPLLQSYTPFQWLNYMGHNNAGLISVEWRASYNSKESKALQAIANNDDFLKEKYFTLLKIISTPDSVLKSMVDFYVKDSEQNKFVYDLLVKRKFTLEVEALKIADFREFLYVHGKSAKQEIVNGLTNFTLTGKQKLVTLCNNIESECNDKIDKMTSPYMLEDYIIDTKQVEKDKKNILISIITDRITNANTLQELETINTELEFANKYAVIKQDKRLFQFLGPKYKNKPVSPDFIDLMKVIEKQKLAIARTNRNTTSQIKVDLSSPSLAPAQIHLQPQR